MLIGASSAILPAYNLTQSKILLHIPFKLHQADGFDHVQAEFGFPNSQGSLAEYVYFIDHPLCSPIDGNRTIGYPTHHKGLETPYVLLVDNGGCSYVTKARHAQMAGASGLLIAQGQCLCRNQACIDAQEGDDQPQCIEGTPLVTNDGSGQDISIPTFMIFKDLAHPLKHHLRQDDAPALVELQWGLRPVVDDQPADDCLPLSMKLWTTAYDPQVSLKEYQQFRTVSTALEGKVHFAPTYSLIDGNRFNCPHSQSEDGPCDHLCSNGGRYCTTHAKDLSGYAIVVETLRRLCIWSHMDKKQEGNWERKDPTKWWDYVLYHKEHCQDDPHDFADEACISKALEHAKIDGKTIDSCMDESGAPGEDVPNAILDEMLQHQQRSGIVSLPAMTVNRQPLDHFSSNELFTVLCAEYYNDPNVKVPDLCKKCAPCLNTIECLESGGKCDSRWTDDNYIPSDKKKKKNKKSGKHGHGHKIFWSFCGVVIIGAAAIRYKRLQDENLGDRPSMEDYFALSNTD